MYSLKGNVSSADYIKAIVGVGMSMPDRLSTFVNALLRFRPAEPYAMPEYHQIAATLVAA
ncbi:MAG: hypothetical protein HQL28_06190 [Candidatus Omnitrophica bacterium]|nr:hypothetical protein [Candidatus Omnitrophota bacterium]